jgi:uncharacterized protein with GYD domain
MVTLLLIQKHTPADCWMSNEKALKAMIDVARKGDEFEAKHGVKMVGFWNVHSEHLVVNVFEAPSFEAWQAFCMEPETMNMYNFGTAEIKIAMTLEETMQSAMKQQK